MMKTALFSFWRKKKKAIITILIVIAIAWFLGQLAVPVLLKEIFLGGHIA